MMNEVIGWIIGVLILLVVVIPAAAYFMVFLPWRFICLFRKTCQWKACPWRCRESSCGVPALDGFFLFGRGCRKCPYPFDDKERAEVEESKRLEKDLMELIMQKRKESGLD